MNQEPFDLSSMKNIAILGSTGSIGRNTLSVISSLPGEFKAAALSANSNIALLERQIKEFSPRLAGVCRAESAFGLSRRIGSRKTKLFSGEDGLKAIAADKYIDTVVMAISGAASLAPLLSALEAGKDVALASKEPLVMAGELVVRAAQRGKAAILPVDSEQSAIWQCLRGEDIKRVRCIYLTASGGPFWQAPLRAFKNASVKEVIRHPRWKMGRKISVDSATMMNKGLELLEAMFLFGLGPEKIRIIIHPQAIVHSMVEFVDGVVMAQLSATDMRVPIQYALTYPRRVENTLPRLDFTKAASLEFADADFKKFPCLRLAYEAAGRGGTLPAVLNAANEACVGSFLAGGLQFFLIPGVVEKVMSAHKVKSHPELGDILEADRWARDAAQVIISRS